MKSAISASARGGGILLAITGALLTASPSAQVVTPDVAREAEVVRRVLAAPKIQQALEYIDASDEETLQEWESLCNAYAPSGPQSRMSRRGYGDEIRRSRLLFTVAYAGLVEQGNSREVPQ